MGLFAQTAVIPGCDEKTAREALERITRSDDPLDLKVSECKFVSNDKGLLVLLNEDCSGYEDLAKRLSKKTGRPVLLSYIYDGDFWGYFFCEHGKLADSFSPIPDYFGEDEEMPDLSGDAALIAERFHVPEETIAPYLVNWDLDALDGDSKAFEEDEFPYGDCWQMADFIAKLGWPWPKD